MTNEIADIQCHGWQASIRLGEGWIPAIHAGMTDYTGNLTKQNEGE